MKHKSGLIGFSYLGGLVCAAFFNHSLVFIPAAVFLAASLILLLLGKRFIAVIFFTAFLSVCAYGIYTAAVYLPAAALDGKTADISGEITEINRFSGDTASYVIKTKIGGRNTYITVFASDNGGKIGDNISFRGKVSLMTDSTVFSAKSFYKSKGVFLTAAPKGDVVINSGTVSIKGIICGYSEYIGERISDMLSGDEGGLIKAMFLGDKSGLSDYLSYNIKRAGISHFTAVSGMHLTIITHIILLIISTAALKRRRYFKFGVLMLLILIFTVFFKMSVSVVRSGIMLILYYGSEAFMRKSSPINSMGFAALIITLFNPYACTDPALLLSLAGTFGVSVAAPVICGLLPKRDRFYGLKSGIVASLCAVLCTFPLSFIFFGGFSTVGVLTNLLIYPLALPAILCTALFAATGGISGGLMFIAGLCAKGMILIINFLGELKYSYFKISYGFIAPIAFAAVLFAVVVYKRFYSIKRTLMAVVLSIAILLSMSAGCMLYDREKGVIAMYSDGNDACVIIKRGGNILAVLTDDTQRLTEKVRQYAKESFIDELSAVCLLNSSNNNDALKGLSYAEFIPPDTEKEIWGDGITMTVTKGKCKISIDGFSVTVSHVSQPKDDMIAILYGYKQDIPKLSGLTFCSCKRNVPENNEFYNFYYNSAEYIITDKGHLQPI